jgi:hypothetical protein
VNVDGAVLTRGRASRFKLPVPGRPGGGQGPEYFAYVFVFLGSIIICRLYKLKVSAQAKVTLQVRVSLI